MRPSIKNLFHIPTWALIFLALAATGALVADLYLFFTIDSFDTITVNGTLYLKGSEAYSSGIKVLKKSFIYSGLLSTVVMFLTLRTINKRRK